MVRWIFALERGKTGLATTKGLYGSIEAPRDRAHQFGLIEATYTDMGRDKVASLIGKAAVKLRGRRIEAEHNDGQEGLRTQGTVLGSTAHGHHLRFANLNLAGSESVTCRVSSGGVGGMIELHQGTPDGELLATIEVRNTGGWDKFVELKAPLKATARRGDVYLVFVNPGKGGLMNIDWVQFNAK
jgi:cytochrome c